MKKFLILLRMNFIDALSYRGDLILFTLSGVTHPMITMFLWLAVGNSGGTSPVSQPEIVTYFSLVLVVALITSSWAGYFISSDIRNGKFSKYLLCPFPFVSYQLANNLSEKFFKLLILLPVLLVLSLFLHPVLNPNLLSILLFPITIILALILNLTLDLSMGLAAFWLDDTSALFDLFGVFKFLLSGYVLPVWALPVLINNVNIYLPFRYILSFPIEIFQNRLNTNQILLGLLIQLIWVVLVTLVFRKLFKSGIVRYGAYGS